MASRSEKWRMSCRLTSHGLSRPSMAYEGPSPSIASGALGLLPVALGLLPGVSRRT
jgi:hypothetical protein